MLERGEVSLLLLLFPKCIDLLLGVQLYHLLRVSFKNLFVTVAKLFFPSVYQYSLDEFEIQFFVAALCHVGAVLAPVCPVASDNPTKCVEAVEAHHDDLVGLLHALPIEEFSVISINDP